MLFLHIMEDGSVFKSFCEPTQSDLEYCDEGILSIIKVEENSSYPKEYLDGKWVDIEQYGE